MSKTAKPKERWYTESDGRGPYICQERGGRVATVECESLATNGGRQDWYRARLIAAAPRIKEALEALRSELCSLGWDMQPALADLLREAKHALDSIPQPGRLITSDDPEARAHIARDGETEYASIHRNRSGIDAGCIDFGLRVKPVEELGDADKKEICSTARALYEGICRYCE